MLDQKRSKNDKNKNILMKNKQQKQKKYQEIISDMPTLSR